jgi:CHAT domain-containing protein
MLAAAADETSEPHMTRLKQVQSEIAQVTELVRHSNPSINVIRHGCELAASVQEVTNVLPQADIVHLACHGKQDAKQPLESGFCLRDGRLTVSALMDIQLDRARLAFLSACETAKGDSKQPDQTVHLAAALLSCGFGSVIATMWCVFIVLLHVTG